MRFWRAFFAGIGAIWTVYGQFPNVALTAAPSVNPMPTEPGGVRLRTGSAFVPLYVVSQG